MSEYESLREDMAALGKVIGGYQSTSISHLVEQSRQIDKLWTDNAALRDELYAVANRLEALTRAVTTSPAEVAAAIVNDANHSTLKIAGRPGEIVSCESCCGSGSVPSGGACPKCAGFGKVFA